ncbi:PREDICTED: serine/arginine repetitive matrix protein 1-like isoform X1 [Lupinus angustifolius]|uniref:serine/arginine repetitive matrix protein 1-like isoform X1 n=1 Tax=Lupinus angustifolius TaxID=3871 RepID=UPI00092F2B0A|nr:PREDICTED: serine/arginine repetitive matrix protein 1-like isoform X1 [Lupinus angustifolius]
MSGGFFRGTSADQDTRFSNKQAKLMKSQKFPPELEHLVDMTKVNMEVMKPWITRRVTEFLGFEDEVLINFIHGLLDKKEVNGKEVQIQITGFMEKNTGKFMKELWTLLLSAQKNASGVPQQFLDAKEEELQKKKIENDRITSEIQRKKDMEVRESMEERLKKLDDGSDVKNNDTNSDPTMKPKDPRHYVHDRNESDKRNGVRSRSSGRHRSRSISRSPEARGRSVSSERIRRSPRQQSISPRRRSPWRSPHRRPYSRQRSRSRSNYRSPSPIRRRMHSPYRRSSPFRQRRTPSPIKRRRSPPARRHRSPSPLRRRRSPPPIRRQRSPSPMQRRSPVMRGSSPSPVRRPPTSVRHRSDSPMQSSSPIRRRYGSRSPRRRSPSPLRRRSSVSGKKRPPSPSPRRSLSPDEWSSKSPIRHVSPSPVRKISPRRQRNSPVRMQERLSPKIHQSSRPLLSGQRDKDRKASNLRSQDSMSTPEKSPIRSVSPQARARNEDRSPRKSPRQRRERLTSERGSSPPKKPRTQKPSHDSPEKSEGAEETYYYRENRDLKTTSSLKKSNYSSPVSKLKDSPAKFCHEDEFSPERSAGHLASEYRHYDDTDWRLKNREIKGDRTSGKGDESPAQQKSPMNKEILSSKKPRESHAVDIKKSDDKDHSHSNYVKNSDRGHRSEASQDLVEKVDRINHDASYDFVSKESDKHKKDRRKHRRSEKKIVSSDEDYSSNSELEDRKEAKRKKKEKQQRKEVKREEKRRRHEERRRRRKERHAEKLNVKSKSDYISEDEEVERGNRSDNEETLSEEKKLEIELRKKALESLKAKRGMDN